MLLLCSEDDALAPRADVERFRDALRRRGRAVRDVTWRASPHVGHLRSDPERYAAAAAAWLTECVAAWHAAQGAAQGGARTDAAAAAPMPRL